MRKEQYYYDYVYVVHGFLEESECRDYIAVAESLGFADAPITTSLGAVMRDLILVIRLLPSYGSLQTQPSGGTGRHATLRMSCPQRRASSTLALAISKLQVRQVSN